MTISDAALLPFKNRLCRYRTPQQPDWVTGKLVAIYSECVSFDGYPVNRTGLQVQAINGSNRPLGPDMNATELSGFLESIHRQFEGQTT